MRSQSVKIFVKFDLPEQVDKEENIAVAAILLDGKNGKVVSGDEVSASDFNRDLSGTDTVLEDRDNISVDTEGLGLWPKPRLPDMHMSMQPTGRLYTPGT